MQHNKRETLQLWAFLDPDEIVKKIIKKTIFNPFSFVSILINEVSFQS